MIDIHAKKLFQSCWERGCENKVLKFLETSKIEENLLSENTVTKYVFNVFIACLSELD